MVTFSKGLFIANVRHNIGVVADYQVQYTGFLSISPSRWFGNMLGHVRVL